MQERRLQCKILPNLNCSSLTTYLKYDQGEDKVGVSYIDPHTGGTPLADEKSEAVVWRLIHPDNCQNETIRTQENENVLKLLLIELESKKMKTVLRQDLSEFEPKKIKTVIR